jgi:SAM-dependent methyltransferase
VECSTAGPVSSDHIAYQSGPASPHRALVSALTNQIGIAAAVDGTSPSRIEVLDVGSGRGELVRALAERDVSVIGFDLDDRCVRMSSRWAPCVQGNLEEIDACFARGSFDLVVCSHVLEHMRCPQETVHRLTMVSRRWLLLAVPNLSAFPLWLANGIGRDYRVRTGHFHGWDRVHFCGFLQAHCSLQLVSLSVDLVQVIPRRFSWLRTGLDQLRILPLVEQRLLPRFVPRLAMSLVALCRKT